MNNIEHYDRMVYLSYDDVRIIMTGLVEAWYELPLQEDKDKCRDLYYRLAEHYHVKSLRSIY